MWMALLWWIVDDHTVENRVMRIKPSTERRPHHHRNSIQSDAFALAAPILGIGKSMFKTYKPINAQAEY